MPVQRNQGARLSAATAPLAAAIALALFSAAPAAGGSGSAAPNPATPAASTDQAKPDGKGKPSKEKRRQQQRANRRQKRPNVIVVMTDDQDDSMIGLDNTVRLIGSRGTTFTNSYVSFPLCCPSRATLLTGQYAHNHGVTSTELPNGYNGLNHANTLAVWLRAGGYRTGMVGKYLNGYGINDGIPERTSDAKAIPPGWSEWYALTDDKDQRRYRYRLNENRQIVKYKSRKKDYVTDVLANKAVNFVKRRAPQPKPFFLWFNPTAPHGEAGRPFGAQRNPTPAPRHLGAFEGAVRPRTPNFNEADVSDKPDFIQATPQLSAAEVLDVDLRYRGRLESMLSVDEAVKRLIGRLRKAGDLGKTYVIFTSDNGLLMGAHRLVLKNYLYEEDTQVPLLIRGPRFPAGAVREQPVSNVDLAPTIAELTRVRPGLTMDGRSLLPAARDPSFGRGREILFERSGFDAGIRSGDWVYIDRGPGADPELYNLAEDPFQLESLHDVPAHNAIEAQLAARLAQLRNCVGAACP